MGARPASDAVWRLFIEPSSGISLSMMIAVNAPMPSIEMRILKRFNGLFGGHKASEVACLAHIRRKFVDVQQSQGSAIAEEAIKGIAKLYAVEKEVCGHTPEERVIPRQKKAKPIFDDLESWLHAQLLKISGKSPLARAIRYALNRMSKTGPYLENGFLELDTVERAVKPVAIGKKSGCLQGLSAVAKPWQSPLP